VRALRLRAPSLAGLQTPALLRKWLPILATSLSIGSGGSGGIFGPGMVIGGLLGASLWRLAYAMHLPGLPPTAAPFVIIAMMALFGGIAHAPLAVMLMVAEMSGNLSLLAPAMVAVGISSWIVGHNTIYARGLARAPPGDGLPAAGNAHRGRRHAPGRVRAVTRHAAGGGHAAAGRAQDARHRGHGELLGVLSGEEAVRRCEKQAAGSSPDGRMSSDWRRLPSEALNLVGHFSWA